MRISDWSSDVCSSDLMVFVPRDRYDTTLRRKLQDILAEAYQGHCTNFSTQKSDEVLARLHVIIKTERGRIPNVDLKKLEARFADAARSTTELLEDAMLEAVVEQGVVRSPRHFDLALRSRHHRHFTHAAAPAAPTH